MKLLIEGDYKDCDFWSFLKCTFLAQLVITLLIYGGIALFLGIIVLLSL